MQPPERIASVDVLRGVALLGILGMNIYGFALPWPAYSDPFKAGGSGVLDLGAWWFTYLLFEMKFMTIFSMLFGAGLALMAQRAAERGGRFTGIYYRRMFWLLLLGTLHGYLMWLGDILFAYAVCGLVLYPLRRLRPRVLLPLGGTVVLITVLFMTGFGFVVLPGLKSAADAAVERQRAGESLSEEQSAAITAWDDFSPGPEKLQAEIEAYRGGYTGQVVFRAPTMLQFQTVFLLIFGGRIAGAMIAGIGLMKLGVFSAARSTRFYALLWGVGYGVGLPLVYYGGQRLVAERFEFLFVNQWGYLPNYFGSLFVAMGHVGAVMLVCRRGVLIGLTRRLAAVGRMALSNYLSQTLICTALFYGWGLGLHSQLGRFALMGVVLAIWLLQLALSPLWLARFRFGPAEWAWRSLSYWELQPMRARNPPAA